MRAWKEAWKEHRLEFGNLVGFAAVDGLCMNGIYKDSGWLGIAFMAAGTAVAAIGLLHLKSRAEISRFDEQKKSAKKPFRSWLGSSRTPRISAAA